MQKAWWFLPSGSIDWWKVHADVASLQEYDSVINFEQIEAQYLAKGVCERMLINADSAVYDRSILTFLFEGNVSTKITFDKNDVSVDILP